MILLFLIPLGQVASPRSGFFHLCRLMQRRHKGSSFLVVFRPFVFEKSHRWPPNQASFSFLRIDTGPKVRSERTVKAQRMIEIPLKSPIGLHWSLDNLLGTVFLTRADSVFSLCQLLTPPAPYSISNPSWAEDPSSPFFLRASTPTERPT